MMHRRQPSARRALLRALGLFTGFAAVMIWVHLGHGPMDQWVYHTGPTLDREQALMFVHGCWTSGNHPNPQHVVVTLPNGKVVYGHWRLVRLALDQVFNGTQHHLTVWGFCR